MGVLQFLEVAIENGVPGVGLESLETDALVAVVEHAAIRTELVTVVLVRAHDGHLPRTLADRSGGKFCRHSPAVTHVFSPTQMQWTRTNRQVKRATVVSAICQLPAGESPYASFLFHN